MTDLMSFMEEAANTSTNSSGGSGEGFTNKKVAGRFWNQFLLSEQDENYVFSVIDIGCQCQSHDAKWPDKPRLCPKIYSFEGKEAECQDCGQPTGFGKQTRVRKNADGTVKKKADGSDDTYEVESVKKPARKHHMFLYNHNFTGATKKKKNSDETYQLDPVVISHFKCGELNLSSKLEKDRNIKNILSVKDQGCLDSAVFVTKRTKVKNPKTGKDENQVEHPTVLMEKGKVTYKVPGIGEVTNQVSKLVIPDNIVKEFENLTYGEKLGIILATQFDQKSVHRDFWESKGVVFPSEEEGSDNNSEDTSLENE